MSYDVHLEIDTGGPEPAEVADCGNYTWNCSPMFRRALGRGDEGLYSLSGLPGGEAAAALGVGILAMEAAPDEYRAMNPKNGWGHYDTALDWLKRIKAACEEHPKATLIVH